MTAFLMLFMKWISGSVLNEKNSPGSEGFFHFYSYISPLSTVTFSLIFKFILFILNVHVLRPSFTGWPFLLVTFI